MPSQPTRPYHHGQLRPALLRAAVETIADAGPAAMSLREVARRAGVTHAAAAYHFGDKAGLLTAVAAQGYRMLARNHRTRRGEVDLVCREGGVLCFVEVRSRTRLDYGSPAGSVTVAKARRVVAAATDWALRHGGLAQDMRFDVVAVDLTGAAPRCELFRNAFDAEGRRS